MLNLSGETLNHGHLGKRCQFHPFVGQVGKLLVFYFKMLIPLEKRANRYLAEGKN